MNAIISFVTDDLQKRLSTETFPAFKRYADKVYAACEVRFLEPGQNPSRAKFEFIRDMIQKHDRVLYLDPWCLLRFDCPNLFDLIPFDEIGVFDEAECNPALRAFARDLLPTESTAELKRVYNTGVIVAGRYHLPLFADFAFDVSEREASAFFSQRVEEKKLNVYQMNHRMNRLLRTLRITGEQAEDSFILNFGEGFEDGESEGALQAYKNFASSFRDYESKGVVPIFRKRIYLETAGALGDVVATEPVVRYVRTVLEPDAEIVIKTEFPEVFDHLKDHDAPLLLLGREETTADLGHLKIYLFPEPPLANYNLMPPIDYAALAAFRGQLPKANRGIKLKVTALPPANVSQHVLVHAGLSWQSKTFPSEWWNLVIRGMIKKGLNVALIGRTYDDNFRGTVDIDSRGCLDLRNKTTLRELFALIKQSPLLVSNDSSPVHISGAFNNATIMITSAKHPDYIWPARKSSLNITMGRPIRAGAPAIGIVNSIFMDRCDRRELIEVLPHPDDVVKRAVEVMEARRSTYGTDERIAECSQLFAGH